MNPVGTETAEATVAVVGGGFAGAAVAYHLARALPVGAARIVVIEPRPALGAGLAYSSPDPSHRINVPAGRMSLESGDPESFARWLAASGALEADAEALGARGEAYPRRAVFGCYVAETLSPLIAQGRITHLRDRAETVARRSDGTFDIRTTTSSLRARFVVLATTHPLPAVPAALAPIEREPGFRRDPYDVGGLERVAEQARVLVVGNGLTAADTVATLQRVGHRGPILTLSRNGLRSRTHPPMPVEPYGDFVSEPSVTALHLLRRIRGAVADAGRQGLGWHGVLDAVRGQGGDIWRALPERERRQVVRHLRSFWDVHRFRIAPQVSALLDRLATEGRLRSLSASLVSSRRDDEGLAVSFRRRGTAHVETRRFDLVINTTGPAHRAVVLREPIRSLHEAGLVDLDRVGLGLATGPEGDALDRNGREVPGLIVAGPLARGTYGELMGLPQVTLQAEAVAARLRSEISARSAGSPTPERLQESHA